MKLKTPEHTYLHAKERMGWTRVQTTVHAHAAYNTPKPWGLGALIQSYIKRHARANMWSLHAGAVFLFAGGVCVAIYKEGEK